MAKKNKPQNITAEEFDKRFDEGEDISNYLDFSKSSKKVNVDLPLWMVESLDNEAKRRGIPRQALMKTVLVEFLDGINTVASEDSLGRQIVRALDLLKDGNFDQKKQLRKKSAGLSNEG